jgi:hypothetical protein
MNELEIKRQAFIEDLVSQPIDNDKFTAIFTQKPPHSGEVVFQDKQHDRFAKALFGRLYKGS